MLLYTPVNREKLSTVSVRHPYISTRPSSASLLFTRALLVLGLAVPASHLLGATVFTSFAAPPIGYGAFRGNNGGVDVRLAFAFTPTQTALFQDASLNLWSMTPNTATAAIYKNSPGNTPGDLLVQLGSAQIPVDTNSAEHSAQNAPLFISDIAVFSPLSDLGVGLAASQKYWLVVAPAFTPIDNFYLLTQGGLPSPIELEVFGNGNWSSYPTGLGAMLQVEGVPLSCQSIISGAVSNQVDASRTIITGTFRPNFGLSLSDAAAACGVVGFDWQQTVDHLPTPSPYRAFEHQGQPLVAPPSFTDPVRGGYVTPNPCSFGTQSTAVQYAYPFYYAIDGPSSDCMSLSSPGVTPDAYTLNFQDSPADACFPGGSGLGCNGKVVSPEEAYLEFTTSLMGYDRSHKPVPLPMTLGFRWKDTFNGCWTFGIQDDCHSAGAISQLSSALGVNPNTGTGGITVLESNGVATVPEPASRVLLLGGLLFTLALIQCRFGSVRIKGKELGTRASMDRPVGRGGA